ncbi:hypothetical protein [Sphingobium sp.]|uniref:hypothetical protein n=1 Tax=Sphingobium sp. TaxID=1912891 RepID=UPI0035C788B3
MKYPAILALCLLSACDALPRDPADTSARIAERKVFTVGLFEAGLAQDREVKALIALLQRRTGARASWQQGSGEALLQQLDDGRLDLALGRFRKNSPWKTEVAFGPPLRPAGAGDDPIELKAAMRNGENRWIMTVESASRAIARGAGK